MFKWIDGNVNTLIATINENNITLNQKAASIFEDTRFVSVGIDTDQSLVAIHPVTKNEIDKAIFTPQQLHTISIGNGYAKISNKALCQLIQNHLQYELNNSKFYCEYDAKNRYLIIDLKQQVRKEL